MPRCEESSNSSASVIGTPGIHGIVLRYGFFYGPNTAWRAENAPEPHISVEAAARATAAAVERSPAGIYNVVDDNDAISNTPRPRVAGLAAVATQQRNKQTPIKAD